MGGTLQGAVGGMGRLCAHTLKDADVTHAPTVICVVPLPGGLPPAPRRGRAKPQLHAAASPEPRAEEAPPTTPLSQHLVISVRVRPGHLG